MKLFLLLLLLVGAAAAQTPPTAKEPAKPSQIIGLSPERAPSSGSSGSESGKSETTRFDLDFPGGTARELVDAMSKARGTQVNVVIGKLNDRVMLPPVRVHNATTADIFHAIATATTHETPVFGSDHTVHNQVVESQFIPAGDAVSDDATWSFVSNDWGSTTIAETEPPHELRDFQLRNYLSDKLTVEDITTAIRTGWDMQGVKVQPVLKYHKETGILIVAGDPKLLDQIPKVLAELPHAAPNSAAPNPAEPAVK
jgi:hypothetical protein